MPSLWTGRKDSIKANPRTLRSTNLPIASGVTGLSDMGNHAESACGPVGPVVGRFAGDDRPSGAARRRTLPHCRGQAQYAFADAWAGWAGVLRQHQFSCGWCPVLPRPGVRAGTGGRSEGRAGDSSLTATRADFRVPTRP